MKGLLSRTRTIRELKAIVRNLSVNILKVTRKLSKKLGIYCSWSRMTKKELIKVVDYFLGTFSAISMSEIDPSLNEITDKTQHQCLKDFCNGLWHGSQWYELPDGFTFEDPDFDRVYKLGHITDRICNQIWRYNKIIPIFGIKQKNEYFVVIQNKYVRVSKNTIDDRADVIKWSLASILLDRKNHAIA